MFEYVLLIFRFDVLVINRLSCFGVELGIDALQKQDFAILKGKRVGLVTNQTGVNSAGTKTRLMSISAHATWTESGFFPCAMTVSVSIPNTPTSYSAYFSDCTAPRTSKAPASVLPS